MKTNKVLYGMLAFGPLVLILIGVLFFFATLAISMNMDHHNENEPALWLVFACIAILIIGTILSFVSLILFILHVSKNSRVPEEQRIMWIIGMVMANPIAQIIYFFLYITKEDEIDARNAATRKNEWD